MPPLEKLFRDLATASDEQRKLSPQSVAMLLGVEVETLRAVACAAYPLSQPSDALHITQEQLFGAIRQAMGEGGLAQALQRLYADRNREHLVSRLVERGWRPE